MGRYEQALVLYRKLGNREQMPAVLNDIGSIRKQQGRYEEALIPYRKALRINRELGNQEGIAITQNNAGLVYWRQDQYEEALARYRESLQIKRDLGDREGVATTLNNMGLIHWNQGEYEQALSRYQASLQIKRDLGDRSGVATTLNNIGIILWKQGRYEEALANYQKSLQKKREIGNREGIARTLNNTGLVYKDQGQYETALARYRASLRIKREIDNQEGIARSLGNIGNILRKQERHEEALEQYRNSLQIERELGNRKGIASTLDNLGNVHRHRGQYEEALARYREALGLYRKIGNRDGIANTLRNVGRTYEGQRLPEAALSRYRESLRIANEIGNRKGIAETLDRIGHTHLWNDRLQAATDTLGRAVRLAEELRLNASSPEARRSLLSTQIETYQALTTAHVRAGRPDSALRSVEQARARLLADQLAGTIRQDTTFAIPPVAALRQTLDADEAALLYTNTDAQHPLTALILTRDTTVARELPGTRVRSAIGARYSTQLRRLREKEGPLTATLAGARSDPNDPAPSLAEAIRLYRSYLTREETGIAVQKNLSRRLYDLLIEPVAPVLRSEEGVIVVPTGALGYLPFETLQKANGQYLVENKKVHYAQSLTILRQLQDRTYPESRRPLLALGGAAYGASSPTSEGPLLAGTRGPPAVGNEEQATSLFRSAVEQLERGRSPRSTYVHLGYDRWPALYGTKLEVEKLKRAVGSGTSLLTGPDASEKRIRKMSASGTLARYRRLHFATHGVAVPEAPELSALVLSQAGASDSLAARDGYLTMREIADLQMQPDVAVLSACRTGLGRVVAGEGVVNLSHAFLRAGANATLVSQWRVLDWSTQQFMTSAYRRAKNENTSFVEAVTQVKRAFISGQFGERNTDPLRWAPFVYYGHE